MRKAIHVSVCLGTDNDAAGMAVVNSVGFGGAHSAGCIAVVPASYAQNVQIPMTHGN